MNYYWKGVEIINLRRTGRTVDIEEAITCFEKVLEFDDECASAYAQLAWTYYIMDYHWTDSYTSQHEILYGKEINKYADKAMYYDSQLDLSLIAKAVYYINEKDYELAISYLEDALVYNPNSYLAIQNLCSIYEIIEDSEKFIEYAIKVVDTDYPEIDYDRELGKERIYAQLGSKYRSLGFFKVALMYLDLAIKTNPKYLHPINEKSQVVMDLEEENNYQKSRDLLLDLIKKDSTNLGYSFLGLSYYVLRDYPNAYSAFKKTFEHSKKGIEDYRGIESGRIAVVFKEKGEPEKAQMQIENYRNFAESSRTPRTISYRLTGYYSFIGDTTQALEHLKIMLQYDHPYHRIRLLRDAPLYDNIRDLPEFQQILSDMQARWQARHDSIKVVFQKKDLL